MVSVLNVTRNGSGNQETEFFSTSLTATSFGRETYRIFPTVKKAVVSRPQAASHAQRKRVSFIPCRRVAGS